MVVHPRTCHEGPQGIISITLLLLKPRRNMAVGDQRHDTDALSTLEQEAEWASQSGWMAAEKLPPIEIRSPDRPARSESLY
jgi:hypothetical protein